MSHTWSSGQAKRWSSSLFSFLSRARRDYDGQTQKTCKFPYCLNICYVKCFIESFAKDRRSRQNRNAHSFKYFTISISREIRDKTDTSNDVSKDSVLSQWQRSEYSTKAWSIISYLHIQITPAFDWFGAWACEKRCHRINVEAFTITNQVMFAV